jgi:hypothetical protein
MMENKNMKTETKISVAFNPTDSVGQDGDWAEGQSREAAVEQAHRNLDGTPCAGENIVTLGYEIINLWELHEVNDRAFDILANEWRLAYRNGWTSDEADAVMRAEIARREAA